MKKRFLVNCVAFTLAEVLITLVIIGVIAAITIPNLSKKWRDHADVVKVKEAYSILSNAYKMALAENGPMESWDWPAPNGSYSSANYDYFGSVLSKYLKVQKYCGHNRGCFDAVYFKKVTSGDYTSIGLLRDQHGKMILANGMRLFIDINNPRYMDNSHIFVDINGAKGPNRFGYDAFTIPIRSYGLDIKSNSVGSVSDCNPTKNSNGIGMSCINWIMRKGNMDYKYRDVSAEW